MSSQPRLIIEVRDATVTAMHAPETPWSAARPARPVLIAPRLRDLMFVALVAVFLASAACASGTPGSTETVSTMPINRIAYIDSDGQLITVNPDGTDRRVLTSGAVARSVGMLAQSQRRDRIYSWPVWSPDGERIAVSLITGTSPNDAEISVQALEASTGLGGAVFVNAAPLTIADGTPHYIQWSPDGRRLGVTAATPEGLTLFVVDTVPAAGSAAPAEPIAVQRGAPLYFDWSPDSTALAVHSGEDVSVLRLDDTAGQLTTQAVSSSRSFRTPAWSPDGSRLAWSAPGGDSEAVWVGRPAEPDYAPLRLTEVEGSCAFLWSSDGQTIAVADRQVEGAPAYRRLRVMSADGTGERVVKEDDWVLGFFWEPNGTRLAWVALNEEDRTMEWRLIDGIAGDAIPSEGDTAVGGLRFSPSGETFLMLAFFDQYARSHSPWAPDGSALAVSGTQQYLSERRNGSGASGARVYVAETVEGGELRDIAGGGIAVWSTR